MRIIVVIVPLVLGIAGAVRAQAPDDDLPATPPQAEAPALPNLFELILKQFSSPGPDGAVVPTPRVLRNSGSRAGGPANEFNTGGQIEEPQPPRGSLGAVLRGKALYHGNYCGKGQRGTGLPPIDALDAACMHHDACYDRAGYASCACDGVLRQESSAVADDLSVAVEIRRRALSVLEAAGAMACRRP